MGGGSTARRAWAGAIIKVGGYLAHGRIERPHRTPAGSGHSSCGESCAPTLATPRDDSRAARPRWPSSGDSATAPCLPRARRAPWLEDPTSRSRARTGRVAGAPPPIARRTRDESGPSDHLVIQFPGALWLGTAADSPHPERETCPPLSPIAGG